jgi:predicted nucleotidyltransferase
MTPALHGLLQTLREHEADLRALGVRHAAIFGSVARGDARADSDVDVLVDLDPERPMGLFEYSRLKLHVAELPRDFRRRSEPQNPETPDAGPHSSRRC